MFLIALFIHRFKPFFGSLGDRVVLEAEVQIFARRNPKYANKETRHFLMLRSIID